MTISWFFALDTSIALGVMRLHNYDALSLGSIKPSDDPLEKYKYVFGGLGELPGPYKIVMDDMVQRVVHATRRFPGARRPRIELVDRQVIVPVAEPNKQQNKIQVCIEI